MVLSCMAVTLVFFKNQFVVIVGGREGRGVICLIGLGFKEKYELNICLYNCLNIQC